MAANLFCERGSRGWRGREKRGWRGGGRAKGWGCRRPGGEATRPLEPEGRWTNGRGNGGCAEYREARKRRVCAEFVSREPRRPNWAIGHSLFLRWDYARSIYRLYSIDYTNLYRGFFACSIFSRASHRCVVSFAACLCSFLYVGLCYWNFWRVCRRVSLCFLIVYTRIDGNDRTVIKFAGIMGA